MIERLFRYRYLITFFVFLTWVIFFDLNNVWVMRNQKKEISALQEEQNFYRQEISRLTREKQHLSTDIKNLERFGREKFRMKKRDEDLYIVEKRSESQ